ncbi:MAG TPA: hypothetical protein VLF14_12470 [Candidatus Binatia bacterium]|nr:hypothetical protein [Candidatus Binatia bacterium]
MKRIDDAGETLIAAVRTAQDWIASLAETVGPPIARRVPELPLPDALRPPRARDVAASVFGFWEGLAKAQNEFTLRMLDAFDPAAHRSKAARHPKAA